MLIFAIAACLPWLTACNPGQSTPPKKAESKPKVEAPPANKLDKAAPIEFRVLVDRKKFPEVVEPAIASLAEAGPEKVAAPGVRWFPIWSTIHFAYSELSTEMAERNPLQFINEILHMVAAERGGVLYVLTWDTPDKALKSEEHNWAVTEAFLFGRYDPKNVTDPDSLVFSLDKQGARRLGEVTSKNKGQWLAIVLEGKLMTASRIVHRLDASGVVTGGPRPFTMEELEWLRRKFLSLPEPPPKPQIDPTPEKEPAVPLPPR